VSTPGLQVAPGVVWPLDSVTETFWWSGRRGSGKTHDCSVFVEELLRNHLQVVVIDPMRVWWGLRSSRDGKGAGYPIPIFGGGPRSDVPLEATAGAYMADLAMAERVSMVLDVKDWSKADLRRFVGAFVDRLRRRNAEPMHLVVEETPILAPQKPQRGNEALLGIIEEVVRLGRGSGIGFSALSQRSAHLNAEVRSQIEVIVAHRTAAPLDGAAIQEWFKVHDPERAAEAKARLPFLPTGTAIVSSTEFLGCFAEVAFRPRETFDSSATPKVGVKPREARTLADVDLAAITAAMAETIERAKADDPRELRLRIAELERQVAAEKVALAREVEVPVIPAAVDDAAEDLGAWAKELHAMADQALAVRDRIHEGREMVSEYRGTDVPRGGPAGGGAGGSPAGHRLPRTAKKRRDAELADYIGTHGAAAARPIQRVDPPVRREPGGAPVPGATEGGERLGKGERTVLDVLADYPEGRTHDQLAFLAGYSAKASTIGVILARLRRSGLVSPGGPIALTPEGLAAAGGARERRSGHDLYNHWLNHPRMGEGERRVLVSLIAAYPESRTHEELCASAGYSPTASTVGVILSRLRKLGLVQKGARRVADEFMESIG